ncbi:hypothetical protein P4V39_21675, partial [Brevibacillus borstelensis]|nr:hypothetical protein [Brevibacillus borstelensis]
VIEASEHKQKLITRYWELKAQVEAAQTKEEIDAINRYVNVNQNVDHSAHQKIDHHGKNQSTRRVGNFFMITIFECSV